MENWARYAVVALDQLRHAASQGTPAQDGDVDMPESDPAMGLLLHYHVPGRLSGEVEPGHLVIVPLRGQPTYGVVTELSDASPVEVTQPILRLVDRAPILPPAMLSLARWIASYYRCTLWQAIAPMLPPGVARRAITTVGLTSDLQDPLLAALGRRQGQVVSLLKSTPKATLTLSSLKRKYSGPASGLISVLRDLENKGVVTRQTQLPAPRSRQQHERIIRLAVPADSASDALRDAAHNAPLQAATLDWLLKRIAATERRALNGNGHRNEQGAKNHALKRYEPEQPGDPPEEGWQLLRDLYLHTGATSSTVTALERKGLVELSQRPIYRKPVPLTAATLNDEAPSLTSAQAAAWREISIALREGSGARDQGSEVRDQGLGIRGQEADETQNSKLKTQNFLLHGVTGSGKTEIYLRAIGMALRMGKQALVLVPEISLTPQAVHRFAARFPGRVALIHSQLSQGQQFDEWRRIREGQADIVVGSRSAVFAPLPRLGLIVVDEEHEWAYKQQDHQPRYHARDVALKRAELSDCVVILGSATPDLATYHRAQSGEYKLLSLPRRVGRRRSRNGSDLTTDLPMPQMQVVDMRAELRSGNHSIFSRALRTEIEATIERREQAILYLNRRGSNSFILCRECGHVPMCHRCDVPLVYHADVYGMICHRCNAFSLTPKECPKCGSSHIKGFGVGTQKVVDEMAALFPRARVLRWDRDTASRQGGHADIMDMFMRGEADVLVGTQMIAKGLDIPRVTLVGVISADTGIFLPDFRAPERSVQLLMQVAGRAGRRAETTHSKVVVQTFNPDHYAIEVATRYDYKGFYTNEIRFRAEHGYPPYGQLARLVYSSTSNERCEQESTIVARHLRRKVEQMALAEPASPAGEIDVLGPAPCFVHKVRGRYRWQVLLRGTEVAPLLDGFYPGHGWSLDVDPMSVL
ncbi:MAG TPA: primosomal protein N' [Chloroflexia bacterium]|nr:primosomal protein N' [Chloroflexia bacterium]